MKIRVVTHSGEDKAVIVDDYNAVEIADVINGRDKQVIVIGDCVFSAIDIKLVEPVSE